MMPNEASPRIAICRLGTMSDAILTLPIVCALRDAFPSAHLGWVAEKRCSSFIGRHPALNAVIAFDSRRSRSVSNLYRARRLLKAERFDVYIDCEGSLRSGMLGWQTGISRRIGFAGRGSHVFNRSFTTETIRPVFQHVTDRTLELLIPLGIHSPRVRWRLPIPPSARTWATKWRRNISHANITLLDPGTALGSRYWDVEKFAQVALHLHRSHDHRSIICWNNEAERNFAKQVVSRSKEAASLAPTTDLHHLSALLEVSNLYISGNLEPLHITVALGTPSIDLQTRPNASSQGIYRQPALHALQTRRRELKSGPLELVRKLRFTGRTRGEASLEDVFEAISKFEIQQSLMRSAA